MKNILLLILVSFTLNLGYTNTQTPPIHEFFVSIIDIVHNTKNKSLELTLKIFTDDFEKALEKKYDNRIFLGTDREITQTDSLINTYLTETLSISVNETDTKINYLGKEVELDVTWCYIEISNIDNINTVNITTTLLTEAFEKQKNIVHLKANNKKRSELLSRGKTTGKFKF